MSQQEQIPESRAWRSVANDEGEQASQFYYKAASKDGKVGPKEEPPLNYDEPMIEGQSIPDYQSGYTARDNVPFTIIPMGGAAKGNPDGIRGQWQQQQFKGGVDGDAYESRYRPNAMNNQSQGVPPWAKPQRNQWSGGQIAILVILGLVVGFFLVMSLIGAIFGLLSMVFFAFIIIGIPFLIIRASIRRSLRRGWGPRMRYRPRRRGSWW
jgi:hypothetical protein